MSRPVLRTRAGRHATLALAALALATIVGLIALWPSGDAFEIRALTTRDDQRAKIELIERKECPQSPRTFCQILSVRLTSGEGRGSATSLTLPGPELAPAFAEGDEIRVMPNAPVNDPASGAAELGADAYSFIDFERRSPLYLLAALFLLVVVALARWKGIRSLVGLAASLLLITQFLVPAILEGEPPLLVALVGALAVMFVTITFAHGTGITSLAAMLGSAVSLLATALLALLFVELAQITGFSSEEASLLSSTAAREGGDLSLSGLVLAGIVVGALGVLDDVTVSQASTVLALRRANPLQPLRRLFGEGLSVGRDHLSATVNTLVLAYVGAALPILLIFETQGTTFGEALNREVVATEVVAMLVGSIGLVLAVPLTTGLAAALAHRLPPEVLAAEPAHDHHHH